MSKAKSKKSKANKLRTKAKAIKSSQALAKTKKTSAIQSKVTKSRPAKKSTAKVVNSQSKAKAKAKAKTEATKARALFKTLKREARAQKLHPFVTFWKSIKLFGSNWRRLIWPALLITLPASLIQSSSEELNTDWAILTTLVGLYLVVVLVELAFEIEKTSPTRKLAQRFNEAGLYLLRLIGLWLILSLIGLPIVLVLMAGTLVAGSIPTLTTIILGLTLICTLPFIYWLVRLSFAPLAVISKNASVFGALSISLELTRWRFFKLGLSYLLIGLVVLGVSVIVFQPISLSESLINNSFLLGTINAVLLAILMPIGLVYVTQLYSKADDYIYG